MHLLEGGSSNQDKSLVRRSLLAILMAFLTASLVLVFVTSTSAGAGEDEDDDGECRIEAEDENDDGDVDEDETQECGGEVFGVGGVTSKIHYKPTRRAWHAHDDLRHRR